MINSITLKNFKCFENQTIPLSNLTLLTGMNGSGKSSVIQSLLALKQSYERDMLDDVGLAVNGELVALGKARDVLFEEAQSDLIEICIEPKGGPPAIWKFDYQSEADVIKSSSTGSIDPSIYQEPLFTDRFQYLTAERIGPRAFYGTSDFFVGQQRKIGTKGEFATQYLARYGDEEVGAAQVRHPNARNTQLKGQVEAWLSEVSPNTQVHTALHPGMDLVNLEYSFTHEKSVTKQFRATNVGFGITYTLPVLVAILAAKAGDLIIVENPEAHLHPRGQRKLGELFALASSANIQLIVESHSDHFLNGLRIAAHSGKVDASMIQLHYFSSERSKPGKSPKMISPKIDQSGRLNEWPEGFFDEYDKSLEALL